MKALRVTVAFLVIVASATVAFRVVLPALHCNREKAIANAVTIVSDRARTSFERTSRAQTMAAACLKCLEIFPNDADLWTLLASNQHVLGQYDEAERNYRRSLELNERAETYAFLALLELDRGQVEEAHRNLLHAGTFDVSLLELVSSPMKEELYEEVMQRHEKLRGSRPTN
jgi:tetratricopeptide (TPR) repeat protein